MPVVVTTTRPPAAAVTGGGEAKRAPAAAASAAAGDDGGSSPQSPLPDQQQQQQQRQQQKAAAPVSATPHAHHRSARGDSERRTGDAYHRNAPPPAPNGTGGGGGAMELTDLKPHRMPAPSAPPLDAGAAATVAKTATTATAADAESAPAAGAGAGYGAAIPNAKPVPSAPPRSQAAPAAGPTGDAKLPPAPPPPLPRSAMARAPVPRVPATGLDDLTRHKCAADARGEQWHAGLAPDVWVAYERCDIDAHFDATVVRGRCGPLDQTYHSRATCDALPFGYSLAPYVQDPKQPYALVRMPLLRAAFRFARPCARCYVAPKAPSLWRRLTGAAAAAAGDTKAKSAADAAAAAAAAAAEDAIDVQYPPRQTYDGVVFRWPAPGVFGPLPGVTMLMPGGRLDVWPNPLPWLIPWNAYTLASFDLKCTYSMALWRAFGQPPLHPGGLALLAAALQSPIAMREPTVYVADWCCRVASSSAATDGDVYHYDARCAAPDTGAFSAALGREMQADGLGLGPHRAHAWAVKRLTVVVEAHAAAAVPPPPPKPPKRVPIPLCVAAAQERLLCLACALHRPEPQPLSRVQRVPQT